MKTLALAATAAAALLGATTAQAAVFIGISTNGGTTINQVFTSADDTFEWSGVNFGGFETLSVEGDAPLSGPALLHSDVVAVNNFDGAADVSIFVTRTGLDGPVPGSFLSTFTGNSTTADFTVTETTYLSSANALWGGTQLDSVTFDQLGAQSANLSSSGFAGNHDYSITHRYDISTTTAGSTSPTIAVLATSPGAVPEPATWGLMIMGFGGAGAMIRRRQARMAAA